MHEFEHKYKHTKAISNYKTCLHFAQVNIDVTLEGLSEI